MLSKARTISIPFNEFELKERNRELSLLVELSNLLAGTMRLETLFSIALDKVLEFLDIRSGRIYLMDEEGRNLRMVSHKGIETRGLEWVSIEEGFTGKSARTSSFIAQYVTELEDQKRAEFLKKKGIEIVICVPLITMNKVEGVMNLAADRAIRLDRNQVDLLTTIGNQIAVATKTIRYYEALEEKIKILQEKNEVIEFFARSISHDLKSPAIAIYGFTKRLLEGHAENIDDKGRAYCEQILKAADHMVVLANQVNTYMVTKEAPFKLEAVDLKEILEAIRSRFSDALEERRIQWVQPLELPEIIVDRTAITNVFQNLIDNALKYGGNALKQIRIGYDSDDDFHIFSVSDDGVGINEENKYKLFELFQRDTSAQGTSGSGLGLAIVKEIAKRHGGRAWVDGNRNQGATFYFSLARNPIEIETNHENRRETVPVAKK